MPFIADSNATTAIARKGTVKRVFATSQHIPPASMFGGLFTLACMPMDSPSRASRGSAFSAEASTTSRLHRGKATCCNHSITSAIASAVPTRMPIAGIRCATEDYQSSESLFGSIYKWRHCYVFAALCMYISTLLRMISATDNPVREERRLSTARCLSVKWKLTLCIQPVYTPLTPSSSGNHGFIHVTRGCQRLVVRA